MSPGQVHDPFVFLMALGGVALIAGLFLVAYVTRRKATTAALPDEEKKKREEEERKLEREIRDLEQKAKKERDEAIKDGKILRDGRPRCQASPGCPHAAEHPAPRIPRDEGIFDFLRRQFGAPSRYRMVEDRERGPLGELWAVIRSAWSEVPPRAREKLFCDVHIHVARQVCLAKLAEDEHDHSKFQRDREVGLATFETAGMLRAVHRLASESEERAAAEERRLRRRRPAANNVTQLQVRPSAANGGSGVRS